MMKSVLVAIPFVLLAAFSIAARAADTKPISLTHFDGVYLVKITTSAGPCEKTYQGSITVTDGRISATSEPAASASGLIEDDGTVSLSFRENGQIAHVGGKMSARRGRGPWSSPTAECGGWWYAERQG
jgi:type 1 fimbria pilin